MMINTILFYTFPTKFETRTIICLAFSVAEHVFVLSRRDQPALLNRFQLTIFLSRQWPPPAVAVDVIGRLRNIAPLLLLLFSVPAAGKPLGWLEARI